MRFKILACSFAMVGLVATLAQAGTMTTTLVPAVRYSDGTFTTTLPIVLVGGRVANGQPGVYQLDVLFTASNGPGDKGWANTSFNAGISGNALGSNLALDLGTGYSANAATLDTNGASPGGVKPIYATNVDAGAPGDLQGLLASIESATIVTTANDTRNNLGTAGAPAGAGFPSFIGSIFVTWNGLGMGDANLTGQQFSFTTTAGTFAPVQAGNGATRGFGVNAIPEPATVTLFSLAILSLVGLVRRRS